MNKTRLLLLSSLLFLTACASSGKKELQDTPRPLTEIHEEARFAVADGDFNTAMNAYREILSRDPENVEGLLGAAEVHLKTQYATDALSYYERILNKSPKNLDALEGRGLARLALGRYLEATRSFEQVLDENDQRWKSWNGLGVIEDLNADYLRAQTYYHKALTVGGRKSLVLNNLGYSHIMAKQYEQAELVLEEGLRLSPGSERIRNNLAIAKAWQKAYYNAVGLLSPDRSNAEAYNNVGYIAMLNKDLVVAKEYFEKAIELSPRYYLKAVSNLERVNRLLAGKTVD